MSAKSDKAVTSFGPYTPVRQVGDLFFVSGQVGVDFATKTSEADAAWQTGKALDNMAEALASVGLTLDDVVKATVFLTNMDESAYVNEVHMERFSAPRPARSMVAVKELPRVVPGCPLKVEIEAIAARKTK